MTMSNISAPLNTEPQESSAGFDYNSWREKFLLTILRISSVLGIGVTAFSIIQSLQSQSLGRDAFVFPTLLAVLLGVTFLRASYNLRAYTLLFATFAIGINGVLTLGTWTDA